MAEKESQKSNVSRRAFLGGLLALGGLSLGAAKADTPASAHAGHGGPAPDISYKKAYPRQTCIVPPGSQGHAHFHRFCTGCQLCVNACPNGVLTNSVSDGLALAAPVLTYERGFCRPDCVRCSEVCPTGAIEPLTKERKTTVQIGRASVDYALCLAAKGEAGCGLCSRRCPA